MDPKFKKGILVKNDRNSNKQTGSDNIPTFGGGLRELSKCDPCGCDGVKGIETLICATTGELLGRYYTGAEGGPYTEVIQPLATAQAAVQVLYDARDCS